jgi:hypothetical protein
MFKNLTSKWIRLAGLAVAIGLALIITGQGASAAPQCKKVTGKFTLTPLTGPTCTSPVALCATGSYLGVIKATSEFVGTSFVSTVDTATTAVAILTGDNLIHTAEGDLMTKDVIAFRTIGAGEFAEVDTIVGGTGAWSGASGIITAVGTFGESGGEGSYSGEICTP